MTQQSSPQMRNLWSWPRRAALTWAFVVAVGAVTLGETAPAIGRAEAAEAAAPSGAAAPAAPAVPVAPAAPADPGTAPVPPHVEEVPVASAGNNYCFEGPHPVDPAIAGGVTWEATGGRHLHPYPPLDLRLFTLREGCYHFIGDPSDFGYRGETHPYYGAHPVAPTHGDGWCFMIGGHAHLWRPWSSFFVSAGPWFYWQGPYDPFFWSYWPYYAVYYGHHYPRYYGGGQLYRGYWHGRDYGGRGGRRGRWSRSSAVAPAIGRVPAPTGATAATGFARAGNVGGDNGFGRNPGWRTDGAGFVRVPGRGGSVGATPQFPSAGRLPYGGTREGGSGWTGTASGGAAPRSNWGGGGGGWRPSPSSSSPVQGWNSLRGSGGGSFRSAPATSSPSFRSTGGSGSGSGGWRRR